jgi:hypothetical protein
MEKLQQPAQMRPDSTSARSDTGSGRPGEGRRMWQSQDSTRRRGMRGEGGERRFNREGGNPNGGGAGQRMMGAGGMGRGGRSGFGRVFVLDESKNLRIVMLRTGLNDNRYVEVLGDALKEGDEVILGILGPDQASAGNANQQTNPFAPRIQGGGGGGGGRGR